MPTNNLSKSYYLGRFMPLAGKGSNQILKVQLRIKAGILSVFGGD